MPTRIVAVDPNSVPTQWDAVHQDNHQENTDNVNQMFRTQSVKFKTVKMKHEEKCHI